MASIPQLLRRTNTTRSRFRAQPIGERVAHRRRAYSEPNQAIFEARQICEVLVEYG
ncbi:MAG: hypothetical protein SFV23_07275 [Planctomycetaceae bacterium]|nr:hypothetical protein [Planctomycetaceae bacterium]